MFNAPIRCRGPFSHASPRKSTRRTLSLVGFLPFKTAEDALENAMAVAEGSLAASLQAFLQANLPAKAKKVAMAVSAPSLGGLIQESLGISCACNDYTAELLRGLRMHLYKFVPALRTGDLERAQLGLAHSYSRTKVKFDVNRADKHIIQSIAILDTLDKDINTFAMRVREWYSWHFPELVKIVPDNYLYAKCLLLIQKRESLTDEKKPSLEAILMDEHKAQAVIDASRHSMGMDIKEVPTTTPTPHAPPSPPPFTSSRLPSHRPLLPPPSHPSRSTSSMCTPSPSGSSSSQSTA